MSSTKQNGRGPVHAAEQYSKLDGAIRSNETTAIVYRWRFGQMLLKEREANGGKKLPTGRLDEVAKVCGRSPREIQYRLQFAKAYESESKMRNALRLQGWESWRDVLASLKLEKEDDGGDSASKPDEREPGAAVEATGSPVQPTLTGEILPSMRELFEEALKRNEETRAELARRQREYDEDERRHGRNPTSPPPMPAESERLEDALGTMAGAAAEVQRIMDLEALISLPEIIKPLPPKRVRNQLRKVRSAYDGIILALQITDPPPRPDPSDRVRMHPADRDGDIDGQVVPASLGIEQRAAAWLRDPDDRPAPLAVRSVEAAIAFLDHGVADRLITPIELQQVAEALAELRGAVKRASDAVNQTEADSGRS